MAGDKNKLTEKQRHLLWIFRLSLSDFLFFALVLM